MPLTSAPAAGHRDRLGASLRKIRLGTRNSRHAKGKAPKTPFPVRVSTKGFHRCLGPLCKHSKTRSQCCTPAVTPVLPPARAHRHPRAQAAAAHVPSQSGNRQRTSFQERLTVVTTSTTKRRPSPSISMATSMALKGADGNDVGGFAHRTWSRHRLYRRQRRHRRTKRKKQKKKKKKKNKRKKRNRKKKTEKKKKRKKKNKQNTFLRSGIPGTMAGDLFSVNNYGSTRWSFTHDKDFSNLAKVQSHPRSAM